MALQPQGYIPRLIDGQIETLLQIFGAVQIDGPKWCGKTWSGQAHANSMTSLDDQNVLPLAEADPAIALIGDQPHLIDEWQNVPKVRDAVRHDIDSNANRPGQYILTAPARRRPNPTSIAAPAVSLIYACGP